MGPALPCPALRQACFGLPLEGLDLTQLRALVLMMARGRLRHSLHGAAPEQSTAVQPPALQAAQQQQQEPVKDLMDFSGEADGAPDGGHGHMGRMTPRDHDPVDDLLGLSLGPSEGAFTSPAAAPATQTPLQTRPKPEADASSSVSEAQLGCAVLCATFKLKAGSSETAEPVLHVQLPQSLLRQLAAPPAPGPAGSAAGQAGSASAHALTDQAALQGSGAGALLPSFVLPPWTPHMCLAEYLPLANERLRSQLEAHCAALITKHQVKRERGRLIAMSLLLHTCISSSGGHAGSETHLPLAPSFPHTRMVWVPTPRFTHASSANTPMHFTARAAGQHACMHACG